MDGAHGIKEIKKHFVSPHSHNKLNESSLIPWYRLGCKQLVAYDYVPSVVLAPTY
jgi:hypothetical protein